MIIYNLYIIRGFALTPAKKKLRRLTWKFVKILAVMIIQSPNYLKSGLLRLRIGVLRYTYTLHAVVCICERVCVCECVCICECVQKTQSFERGSLWGNNEQFMALLTEFMALLTEFMALLVLREVHREYIYFPSKDSIVYMSKEPCKCVKRALYTSK